MRFGRFFWFLMFSLSIVFCVVTWTVPFNEIYNVPNTVVGNNCANNFGPLVNIKYDENEHKMDFMLLNTIKLHSVNTFKDSKYVYLGGDTLGFSFNGDGVLVVSNNGLGESVDELQAGDIIKSINGIPITKVSQIGEILNKEVLDTIDVKIVRKQEYLDKKLKPTYDAISKKYKLGIWARDEMSGIGTLTYINAETGRFGALGHPIVEPVTKTALQAKDGEVHKCMVLGVRKGQRGVPGELKGIFVRGNSSVGSIDKNCENGIYGNVDLANDFLKARQLIEVGGRMEARPGKAFIYSCIDGKNIRPYEIEIIKTNYQGTSDSKNLVFKITDKRLLDATGGIVQGMSGSPIVQNEKLIGAVTHVFVNDPTKGFGIYIDTMLLE